MRQEADQEDGEGHERPVLPELGRVVAVARLAIRVGQVEALVEDVARRDVVHAERHEHLAVRLGARQVLPAVRGHHARVLRDAGAVVGGQHVAGRGAAQGEGARVARGAVPGGQVGQGAHDGLARVRVQPPEVDTHQARARQGEGGAALPPGEAAWGLALGHSGAGFILQAEQRGEDGSEAHEDPEQPSHGAVFRAGVCGLVYRLGGALGGRSHMLREFLVPLCSLCACSIGGIACLDRLCLFHQMYQTMAAKLVSERWLLNQCSDPHFFSRMHEHSDLCFQVGNFV